MKYSTIVADPPWLDQGAGPEFPNKEGAHYRDSTSRPVPFETMTVEAICDLDVKSLVDKNAHLYCWVINRNVEDVYAVARAWGFRPVTLLTWCKTPSAGFALGGTYKQTTEHFLFARRGTLKAHMRQDSTWFHWPRTGKHARKPPEFYDLVESTSPGPFLELFARSKRNGWHSWGNEVDCDVQIT